MSDLEMDGRRDRGKVLWKRKPELQSVVNNVQVVLKDMSQVVGNVRISTLG